MHVNAWAACRTAHGGSLRAGGKGIQGPRAGRNHTFALYYVHFFVIDYFMGTREGKSKKEREKQ